MIAFLPKNKIREFIYLFNIQICHLGYFAGFIFYKISVRCCAIVYTRSTKIWSPLRNADSQPYSKFQIIVLKERKLIIYFFFLISKLQETTSQLSLEKHRCNPISLEVIFSPFFLFSQQT